jgi:hypothetical protein
MVPLTTTVVDALGDEAATADGVVVEEITWTSRLPQASVEARSVVLTRTRSLLVTGARKL